MKKASCVICLFVAIFWGNAFVCAEPQEDLHFISFPNKFGVTGLYTLIGTDTLGAPTLSFGIVSDFSELCLPEDPRTPQLWESGLHASFSFNERSEIGVLVPYRYLDVSDKPTVEGFDDNGIGDILVTAKYRLLDESVTFPALGGYMQLSFPTGDADKGFGSGTVDTTLGVMVKVPVEWVNLYGNIGMLFSGWDEGDPNPLFDNYQDTLLYGFGLELPANNERFRLFSEFTFLHEFGNDNDRIVTYLGEEIDDIVDDAGQASIGAMFNIAGGLIISGGAAFRTIGEESVPDSPVWRGFINLAYVFGRGKVPEPVAAPIVEEVANQCPEITQISASHSETEGGGHVQIAATAVDPDNDPLSYVWNVTGGKLAGQESEIVWIAPECSEIGQKMGTYDIKVEVSDGKCTVDQTITLVVKCAPEKKPEVVILFPSGTIKINNIAKAQLDNFAALLKQFPDHAVIIEGHTDATGSEKANMQIGLQRAENVKIYLVKRHGIDAKRITISSYGSTRPIATNDTQEGRDKNRRVEIYRTY